MFSSRSFLDKCLLQHGHTSLQYLGPIPRTWAYECNFCVRCQGKRPFSARSNYYVRGVKSRQSGSPADPRGAVDGRRAPLSRLRACAVSGTHENNLTVPPADS